MTRNLILVFALISLALAWALGGGTAAFGRLAMALGVPGIAAKLFDDPGWRGAAAYRTGQFDAASEAFAEAGSTFNLGNAHVQAGRYAAALEAYDRAMFVAQDPEAEANFNLVRTFYAGTEIDPDAIVKWFEDREGETVSALVGQGNARAAGSGDGVTNTGSLVGLPDLVSTGIRQARKVFDDKFMVASPRWLATLDDVPGEYLAERISHERKRRAKAGIGQPDGDPPW